MTYQEVWNEQKQWLEKSIEYLKERQKATTGKEQERVKAKLEGMTVAYQHMLESEKIYELKEKDSEEQKDTTVHSDIYEKMLHSSTALKNQIRQKHDKNLAVSKEEADFVNDFESYLVEVIRVVDNLEEAE